MDRDVHGVNQNNQGDMANCEKREIAINTSQWVPSDSGCISRWVSRANDGDAEQSDRELKVHRTRFFFRRLLSSLRLALTGLDIYVTNQQINNGSICLNWHLNRFWTRRASPSMRRPAPWAGSRCPPIFFEKKSFYLPKLLDEFIFPP